MNRRRARISIRSTPPLARWIVIITFRAATGLSNVYLSVQLHHQGVQRRSIEQELPPVPKTKTPRCRSRRSPRGPRSSGAKEGDLKMIPITEQEHRLG